MSNQYWGGPPTIQKEEIPPLTDENLLGKGTSGSVFRGKVRSIDVAIKRPNARFSARQTKAFLEEAKMMSKLNHPCICLFMGVCVDGGTVYLASQIMKGELRKSLYDKSINIPLIKRLNWAVQAAQGMDWLHNSNPMVLHRDLKPANILLDEADNAKLCDFGLSDLMEGAVTYDTGRPKGTPLFMAPEVFRKQEITGKVDVYSFGILLWAMYVREAPFKHHFDYATFKSAICDKHERPPIPDDCPVALKAVMEECWAPKPEDRPSFSEIIPKLESILKEEIEKTLQATIPDNVGIEFWRSHFSSELVKDQKVTWEQFRDVLYKQFQMDPPRDNKIQQSNRQGEEDSCYFTDEGTDDTEELADLSEQEKRLKYLKLILAVKDDADEVKLQNFGRLSCIFGPVNEIEVFDRIADIVSPRYFRGYVAKYTDSLIPASGQWITRFSNRKAHTIVLTVKENKKFKHFEIEVKPNETNKFHRGSNSYASLQEVVNAHVDQIGEGVERPNNFFDGY